jgi:hypothetical protein
MEVSGQLHAQADLPTGKINFHYPWDRKMGGLQSRSERCAEKSLPPRRNSNPNSLAVQLAARRYTDCANKVLKNLQDTESYYVLTAEIILSRV